MTISLLNLTHIYDNARVLQYSQIFASFFYKSFYLSSSPLIVKEIAVKFYDIKKIK